MATSLALASALEGSTDLLLERNVHIYGSVCMKTGIDLNTLADNKVMLEKLLELDRRGGIFSQQCMEQGLITALTNKDQLVSMQAKKTADMESGGEVVALVAYKIRVMLAHIRKAYDACQDFDNHKLKDLFTICSAQKEPTTKKARKDIRLGSRPHPFLAFRCKAGEEEEDDYIGIEPQFVTKYLTTFYTSKLQNVVDSLQVFKQLCAQEVMEPAQSNISSKEKVAETIKKVEMQLQALEKVKKDFESQCGSDLKKLMHG